MHFEVDGWQGIDNAARLCFVVALTVVHQPVFSDVDHGDDYISFCGGGIVAVAVFGHFSYRSILTIQWAVGFCR